MASPALSAHIHARRQARDLLPAQLTKQATLANRSASGSGVVEGTFRCWCFASQAMRNAGCTCSTAWDAAPRQAPPALPPPVLTELPVQSNCPSIPPVKP